MRILTSTAAASNFVRCMRRGVTRAQATFATLLAVSACGIGVDVEDRLARGEQALTDGEYRAAAIDARSVLQEQPDNLRGRVLLGESAIALGDPATSEKELRRALELGGARGDLTATLGEALLQQRKFQTLLDEITVDAVDTAERRLRVQQLRGDSYLALEQASDARSAYEQVLAEDASAVEAKLGIVSTYLVENRVAQARSTLDVIRASHADEVSVWILSGFVSQLMGNTTGAETDYRRALELARVAENRSAERDALRGLIESLLLQNELDAAESEIVSLESLGADPATHLLRGRLQYAREDWSGAQSSIQDALRLAPDFRQAQMLLGAIHLNRGNLEQAEMYLSAALAATPDDANARRLLAETRIQQRKLDLANNLLQPLVDGGATDLRALAAAARASIAAGDFEAARAYMTRRADAEPANSELRLDLAATYLATGDLAAAEALLRDVEVTDADQDNRRRMLLIFAQLRSGDPAAALAAAERMVADSPDDERLYMMIGGIHASTNDLLGARSAYERAVELNPRSLLGRLSIAGVDVAGERYEAAREQYDVILADYPESTETMVALARLEGMDGNAARMVQWLERARATSDSEVVARLHLGRYYLAANQANLAGAVAREAVEAAPTDAGALNLLGRTEAELGNQAAAIENFRRASEFDAANVSFRLDHARSLLADEQDAAALEVLNSIVSADAADDPSALSRLAVLQAEAGNPESALQLARQLDRDYPTSVVPKVLLGEIHYGMGDARRGAAAYDQALARGMTEQLALRSYDLRRRNGVSNPEQPLKTIIDAEPQATYARLMLAQSLHGRAQMTEAVRYYEEVLEADPVQPIALNNLAWVYLSSNDQRAATYARRAYEAAPDNDSIVDTYGWILTETGNVSEGLTMLRKASELSNGRDEVQYHLAVALQRSGDAAAARSVLEELLESEADFSSRADAEDLLASLP